MAGWEGEERDDRGRWSGGGGGAGVVNPNTGGTEHPGTVADLMGEHGNGDGPAPATWEPSQYGEVESAVQHALDEHPQLAAADHPLVEVGYVSGASLANENVADMAIASMDGSLGLTDVNEGNPLRVMLNDTADASAGRLQAMRDEGYSFVHSPEDIATHELGHAFFATQGITDKYVAAEALQDAGFGPRELNALGSQYGAAAPQEGLAELYVAHETGQLSNAPAMRSNGEPTAGEANTRYETMVKDLEAGRYGGRPAPVSGYTVHQGPNGPIVVGPIVVAPDSPLMPAVMAAIAANLRADRWVQDPFGRLGTEMFKGGARKVHPSTGKMPG